MARTITADERETFDRIAGEIYQHEHLNMKEIADMDTAGFERLGTGLARVVFDLEDGYVLKCATRIDWDKHCPMEGGSGIVQNRNEVRRHEDMDRDDLPDWFAQVEGHHEKYLWIVQEKVTEGGVTTAKIQEMKSDLSDMSGIVVFDLHCGNVGTTENGDKIIDYGWWETIDCQRDYESIVEDTRQFVQETLGV